MQLKGKFGPVDELQSIVIVHSPKFNREKPKDNKGFYADNLAFEHDELITRSAADVYRQLTVPDSSKCSKNGAIFVVSPKKQSTRRAIISGALLAVLIVLFYFWIRIRFIDPNLMESFQAYPEQPSFQSRAMLMPKIDNYDNLDNKSIMKSTWVVDYDLPVGVPVLNVTAKQISKNMISCPPAKVALALTIESDSNLAESWLADCSHNIEYFRIDGDPKQEDIDNLIKYLNNAKYLPLKATLNMEKGEDIKNNKEFQKIMNSDEIIRTVIISGHVTPKTIEELIEAVPFAEDLTIKGDAICSSLKRSRKQNRHECKRSWHDLQKLRLVETGDCLGMFDLIYSCWDMPSIETLQVRKSNVNDDNANYISKILDKYRIMKVDFADNVCFGNTMIDYPFMCQPSS